MHIGQARLEYSSQLRRNHVCDNLSALTDQHWIKRRIQRHRISRRLSAASNLRYLIHMPDSPSSNKRGTPRPSLDAWKSRSSHQHRSRCFPARGLGLHFLPGRYPCHGSQHELECCHVLWNYVFCCRVLFLLGKIHLFASCEFG